MNVLVTRTRSQQASASKPSGELEVAVLTDVDRLDGLRDEWRHLLSATGHGNPFLVPEWQITWARHFTRPGELRLVTVRRDGSLIAVAPFYRRVSRLGPVPLVARTRLVGRGSYDVLTELPQVLCEPGSQRKALRAVLSHLTIGRSESDWLEVSLAPEQGWVEPEWVNDHARGRWVTVHSGVVPTVVMPLPPAPEDLHKQLKRNVIESIRRSVNRLKRAGVEWRFEVASEPGPDLEAALERLVGLHTARAREKRRLAHTDYFTSPGQRAFLHEAAQAMASDGHAKVCSLVADGHTIASVLLLRVNGGAFFSVSGMDPAWWDFGPTTLLQRECLRNAIESGDRVANLSRGPNEPKLRWAENLQIHHDFNLVSGRSRSRRLFGIYGPYRTLAEFRMRARQPAPMRAVPPRSARNASP